MFSMMSGEKAFNLSSLKDFLNSLASDVTDIHCYINSGGGSVIEGWAIYDKLKASGYNITTIGEGIVGSIATVIYMAGSVRKLHENSTFFIHNPYCQPDGSPMAGDDLISLGEDLKAEQKKILDFYVRQTGTDINIIEPLMSKATDLTTTQAIELGFAQEVIGESISARKYQLVAYVKPKTKQEDMSKVNDGVIAKMNKFFKDYKRVISNTFFDMDITATNEAGESVNLVIESDTEDLTGKPAFVVDKDGNKIPAPDGDYVDDKGRTIGVIGGKVGEVATKEEEATELEKLKAQLKSEQEKNALLEANVQSAKAETETIKAKVSVLEPQFEALKNTIIGEGAQFDTGTQEFKAAKLEKPRTHLDETAERIKNSRK